MYFPLYLSAPFLSFLWWSCFFSTCPSMHLFLKTLFSKKFSSFSMLPVSAHLLLVAHQIYNLPFFLTNRIPILFKLTMCYLKISVFPDTLAVEVAMWHGCGQWVVEISQGFGESLGSPNRGTSSSSFSLLLLPVWDVGVKLRVYQQ